MWLLLLWCIATQAQQGLRDQPTALPLLPLKAIPDSAFYAGTVAVKFKSEIKDLQKKVVANGGLLQFGEPTLDRICKDFGIFGYKWLYARVFADAEQTEKLEAVAHMQQAGLQQWFHLRCNAVVSVKQLIAALQASGLVEVAEPVFKLRQWWVPNDERFSSQWHYQNTGQSGGSPGADIKLPQAWDIETGKPNVLVSVHDGGINATHPDLGQNMWSGIGYNFVADTSLLEPDQHASHVAGVVAAVSNNNLGVSGVAGGNGSPNSGVRLMSMQIIGRGNPSAGYEALSFVFAANNGAAISQNSWSYTIPNVMPQATREAIDFFMTYGGGGVTKGGLVVFAAGNDNSNRSFFPPAYPPVLTVAATNHFDKRSSYSSYGSFVDLSAPGGDFNTGLAGGVFSTGLGSNYVAMQGTSMACPHVSGVAALIASHAPGRLLASDVAAILRLSTDDIAAQNPGFTTTLGSGRLNAYKALQYADALVNQPVVEPPMAITLATVCTNVQLNWSMPQPNTQVMVVHNNTGNLGFPNGKTYNVGDTLPGGGLVIYVGTGNQYSYPLGMDGSTMDFALYANPIGTTHYSRGEQRQITVPQTVVNIEATSAKNSINLQWQRQCPNRGVLLATSTASFFGTPQGPPEQVTTILGGGSKLSYGTAVSFSHKGLLPDQQYFYALYSYALVNNQYVYSQPQIVAAATNCPQTNSISPESFSGGDFPPEGWRLYDGGANGSVVGEGRTWKRYDGIGSQPGDLASAYINAYAENGNNSKEVLRSRQLRFTNNLDSVLVLFDYAYQMYSNDQGFIDSLELAVSSNCGITITSIWKAGGAELATVGGFETNEFLPRNPEQWRHMRLNVTAAAKTFGELSFLFRATNRYGQNIFLDNIQVLIFEKPVYDASVEAVAHPTALLQCGSSLVPAVRLRNAGDFTIDSIALHWQLNADAVETTWLKNLRLVPGKDTNLTVGPKTIPIGNHRFSMWSSLPNGVADANPGNDTVRQQLAVTGTATTPFAENFEGNGLFPAGWGNINPDNDRTWTQQQTAAYRGTGSLVMPNFNYTNAGQADWLLSPTLLPPPQVDSLLLTFHLAAAVRSSVGLDTLELAFTTDCGQTFTPIYKKWGSNLQTLSPPNTDFTTTFVPTPAGWQMQRIDLTPHLTTLGAGYQLAFKNTTQGGNNVYVDDVQVFGKTLPSSLKTNGFELYPNPTSGVSQLHFLNPPTTLRAVVLYSSIGQKLWQRQYGSGLAPQIIDLSLNVLPAGVYVVTMQFTDKTISRRLIKLTP